MNQTSDLITSLFVERLTRLPIKDNPFVTPKRLTMKVNVVPVEWLLNTGGKFKDEIGLGRDTELY